MKLLVWNRGEVNPGVVAPRRQAEPADIFDLAKSD
jgi:hypothetical protein